MSEQTIREARDARNALVKTSRDVLDKADAEKRGLTAEDTAQLEKIDTDLNAFDARMRAEEKVAERESFLRTTTREPIKNDPAGEAGISTREGKRARRMAERSNSPEYKAEYRDFLTEGRVGPEMRALQADADAAGGYTVPPQEFVNQLVQAVHDITYVAAAATNYNVDRAESLGVPVLNTQLANATWGTELTIGTADTALNFIKRELRPHPMATAILVSKKLLRQSAIDVEALVRDQFAYHFAVPLEQAFLQGNGAGRALGIFSTDANNPITTGQDITGSSSGVIASGDDIISTKFQLKQQYWNTASWMVNRSHFQDLRKLKDSNGQYLYNPAGFGQALTPNNNPDTLLGRPIIVSEYVPQSTASNTTSQTLATNGSTAALTGYVAVFGQFSYYWTVTALDFQIQRLDELKAETNQTEFIGRLEMDGMPVLGEAFARLRAKGY